MASTSIREKAVGVYKGVNVAVPKDITNEANSIQSITDMAFEGMAVLFRQAYTANVRIIRDGIIGTLRVPFGGH